MLSKLNPTEHTESVKEAMRDGVLHEVNKINFLGIEVNPAVLSAYIVTGIILLAAVLLRIFAIPKFKLIPGKFQSLLEMPVEFFSGMAKTNSPHKKRLCRSLHFQCGDLHISQHFVRTARHSGRHDTRRINSTSRTNRRH